MVNHKAQDVAARPRTEDINVIDNIDFNLMLLPKHILEGLKKSHYVKPSPIQRKAIPLVRCGLDLIVQAKAGTGKTCIFTVAALEIVQPNLPHLQAVILAPTREIALQITDVINAIGQAVPSLKTSCFIGGYPVSLDVKNAIGCHIAVGAPGRMRHLLDKGLLKPQHVRLFVLDEADKLMEEAFVDDINKIFSYLPESKQVLACSATYTPQLVEFLSCYMHQGQYVAPSNAANSTMLLGIRQYVSVLSHHVDKLAALKLKEKQLLYLLKSVSFHQCLVFSNLHSRAVSVCNMLRGEGWSAHWIAGRQEQADRVIALSQLKEQRVRVLVTTDLTARGIDVENINLIINLDLPMDYQTYLHRMGRAGRYGSHGIVITVVSAGEELIRFQKMLGAIGGASQSVNCVPKELKNIDLWSIAEEDLEKVHGIVESPLVRNSADTTEKTEDSTDTDEKFSQESSDLDDSQDQKNCNGKHISKENTCVCGLYEVDSSKIETISNPSLFSVSKKESHWQDVLPVSVYESKLPLNTPIAVFGSKLIRVKLWDRMQKNILNDDLKVENKFVINFESKDDEQEILSFEKVMSILENGVKLEIDIEVKHCEGDKPFSFQEIKDLLENMLPAEIDVCEESNRTKCEEIQQILVEYENKRKNLENTLLAFDSFDVVGWMAVDVTQDIWEDIKTCEGHVFEFDLVKCPSGKTHIKIFSSPSDLVQGVSNSDENVLALNLEEFNFLPTNYLENLLKAMTESVIRPYDKETEDKTVISEKHCTLKEVTTESATTGLNQVKNNVKHRKKNHLPKQNQKGAKDSSNFTKNDYKHIRKCSQETTAHYPVHNKFLDSKARKESKKKISSINSREKSTSPQVPTHLYPKVTIDIKKTVNSVNGSTSYNQGLNNCHSASTNKVTRKYCAPGASGDVRTYRKSAKMDCLQKEGVLSQSDDESDTSSLEAGLSEIIASEESFNYRSTLNGHHRSLSVTSEESGPYVDMSQSLMKWQELHDCEESDSESSEESDVLLPTVRQHARDSYSDTTDCSHEAPLPMHNIFPKQVAKEKVCHEHSHKNFQQSSEESYDSVATEVSNRLSFETAKSQHYGTANCDNDFSFVPSFNWNHFSNCEHDSFDQSQMCTDCDVSGRRLHEYIGREHNDSGTSCPLHKQFQRQFAHSSPQSSTSCPHERYHGSNKDPGPNTRLGSGMVKTISGPNLFNKWYTTWYSEVRQKAHELAMAEYIDIMSTP